MQFPARIYSEDPEFHCGYPGSGRDPPSTILMSLSSDERRSNNNISDVRPSSRRQREYIVYLVGNCPSLCLSVNQLPSNLRYHQSILNYRQVKHDTSATASAVNGCFLIAVLSMRRGFLSITTLELRTGCLFEDTGPGASARTDGFRRVRRAAQALVRAGSLAAHGALLRQAPGARRVAHLRKQPRVPGQLPAGLQPGARRGVAAGRVYQPRDLIDALRSAMITLDTLNIMSLCCCSSVGVHMLHELLLSCEAATGCVTRKLSQPVPAGQRGHFRSRN
ncbi:hypothetical protein MTO96_013799 [Rhipicephalus appendiculatus]